MNVLLSWLNDFAPFGTDADALAASLSQLGMAVESTRLVGVPIEGVIVARVLERAKHPNADRIGLVFVDVGDGQSLQICCGAFNMQAGDLVPLATIGTVMPDGRLIPFESYNLFYRDGRESLLATIRGEIDVAREHRRAAPSERPVPIRIRNAG
jgi:hypothetical protein